jgi:hypothetical protein
MENSYIFRGVDRVRSILKKHGQDKNPNELGARTHISSMHAAWAQTYYPCLKAPGMLPRPKSAKCIA